MKTQFKRLVMRLFGKKQECKTEKITLTIKNGKLVCVYIPAHIATDPIRAAMARQEIACFEIKLNGHPLDNPLDRLFPLLFRESHRSQNTI